MKRYRSKPTEVMAVHWTGDNFEELKESPAPVKNKRHPAADRGVVDLYLKAGAEGVQGWVFVPVGHWIVWNPSDPVEDYWPVAPEYFTAKYEEHSDD